MRGIAVRAAFGLAGSALAGFLAFDVAGVAGVQLGGFRGSMLDPARPAFQCLSVGLVAALILALVRSGRASACLAIAVSWGALVLGQSIGAGGGMRLIARPVWALAMAGGLFLVALLYDALAREGHRAGKFLVTAPFVSGFYVAAAPAVLAGGSATDVGREILMFALLGLLVGNGTAFGVEVAEFLLPSDRVQAPPANDSGN
jgi:hypothetical protein